jgi:hypothetical protein
MRFILLFLFTVGIVFFLNPLLPYWIIMILIGLASALVGLKGGYGFLAGGLGMGLAWLAQALYISVESGSNLPDKIGDLMGLGSGINVAVVTAILGFILGAFSAWTGSLLRNLNRKTPDNVYRG